MQDILLLLQKLKLGRTKPSTGPHAAHGLQVVHSWSVVCIQVSSLQKGKAVEAIHIFFLN